MVIGTPDGLSAPGNSRIEVRWILRGPLPGPVVEWFERFPATTEARQDSYLVSPHLPGLAVKIRGDLALDIKEYHGTSGILSVPNVAEGRLESWSKWSFPFSSRSRRAEDSLTWRLIGKRRRLSAFLPDDDQVVAAFPVPANRLVCTVELSEVTVDDKTWWTFAFESTGPADRLREAIEVTASRFLSAPTPQQFRFDLDDSRPYSTWLEELATHR